MNNLVVRALTGLIFISLVIGSFLLSEWAVAGVFGLFLILGLIEYFGLFKNHGSIETSAGIGVSVGMVFYSLYVINELRLFHFRIPFSFLIIAVIFAALLVEIWRKKSNPMVNSAMTVFAIFYLVIPMSFIVSIADIKMSHFPIAIGMFIIIWTNDTCAYLAGRFFGKNKLIERISPKKTWEGAIGGFVFSLIAGFVIGYAVNDLVFWIVGAAIIAPCAILGDLLESSFKRSMNVKDSGSILPGHGGILDRFDATFVTVPFFIAWFFLNH